MSWPGPLLRLACFGGGQSGPGSPLPGLGLCAPRRGGGRASLGGCLPLLRGASDVRRSPSPDCPPTGRAVGVHYPRAVGAGVWVWGPNAVPLACMPCGGCVPRGWRGAVTGGGAYHRCEGRLRSGAPPPPTARPLGGLFGSATHVLQAWACGCGGPSRSPWPACPVRAACRGGCRGPSPGGGGWPANVVRGVLFQALSLPRQPILWGGRPGFRDPCVPDAAGAGAGPSTGPTACALAGRQCSLGGWRKGVPGGGCLPSLWGASVVRLSPSPNCPPTGRAGGVRHPHAVGAGVWVWGPNTVPLACMPCGGCVPRRWWGPSPGGLASHRCEGRLVSGAVPPPAAHPLGWAAGVLRPVCPGCGRCGCGDPAPAPQRAPLRTGIARCGGGGRASPGGVPSTVLRGV